jgi:hypothetical protein
VADIVFPERESVNLERVSSTEKVADRSFVAVTVIEKVDEVVGEFEKLGLSDDELVNVADSRETERCCENVTEDDSDGVDETKVTVTGYEEDVDSESVCVLSTVGEVEGLPLAVCEDEMLPVVLAVNAVVADFSLVIDDELLAVFVSENDCVPKTVPELVRETVRSLVTLDEPDPEKSYVHVKLRSFDDDFDGVLVPVIERLPEAVAIGVLDRERVPPLRVKLCVGELVVLEESEGVGDNLVRDRVMVAEIVVDAVAVESRVKDVEPERVTEAVQVLVAVMNNVKDGVTVADLESEKDRLESSEVERAERDIDALKVGLLVSVVLHKPEIVAVPDAGTRDSVAERLRDSSRVPVVENDGRETLTSNVGCVSERELVRDCVLLIVRSRVRDGGGVTLRLKVSEACAVLLPAVAEPVSVKVPPDKLSDIVMVAVVVPLKESVARVFVMR